jgi:hypothetical protein
MENHASSLVCAEQSLFSFLCSCVQSPESRFIFRVSHHSGQQPGFLFQIVFVWHRPFFDLICHRQQLDLSCPCISSSRAGLASAGAVPLGPSAARPVLTQEHRTLPAPAFSRRGSVLSGCIVQFPLAQAATFPHVWSGFCAPVFSAAKVLSFRCSLPLHSTGRVQQVDCSDFISLLVLMTRPVSFCATKSD